MQVRQHRFYFYRRKPLKFLPAEQRVAVVIAELVSVHMTNSVAIIVAEFVSVEVADSVAVVITQFVAVEMPDGVTIAVAHLIAEHMKLHVVPPQSS